MREVPLKTRQSEVAENNILAQTTKPKLAQYFHATLFSPTTARLLKAIKQGFLNTWSSPRFPLFLHTLSFEFTSKMFIDFISQFSVYFHI